METQKFTVEIGAPVGVVFGMIQDKSVYPRWTEVWGEDMTFKGDWVEGEYVYFFDPKQGGTKAIVREVKLNECIKFEHVGMFDAEFQDLEVDEMIRKWIGTKEEYYFKELENGKTELEVVMVTHEDFAEMSDLWDEALQSLKKVCEK